MVLVCVLKWPDFEVLEGKSYQPKKRATTEVMKRPACILGTHPMSHVQELSRTAQNCSSFLSCCLQNLPRSLTRALLPGQGERWFFASGHHIQRSPERNSESVSHGQHNAVQLTTAIQLLLRLLHSGKNLLGSLTTPLFAHVVPIGREGRWPMDSYQSGLCNTSSWQGDGEMLVWICSQL